LITPMCSSVAQFSSVKFRMIITFEFATAAKTFLRASALILNYY